MMIDGDARSPVQETANKNIRHYLREPTLSIEETPLKPQIPAEYNSTSAEKCRWQNVDKMLETNIDNCAIEDCGPDHKPSTCNGQGLMDLSCDGPNSNASEDKRKTTDDTSVKDNVSTAFQQDGNNTMSCAPENNALIVPLSGTIFKENNLAPEGHSLNKSTTQFSETEHNAEVGYRPNDGKRAIPGASKTGQNASDFKTADSNNIYEDTTITGSKLRGRGDMENKSAIDLENETSTDHGRDNNFSICHRSNIEETNVKEEKSDGTLPMANASESLQQDVTKDIRLDGNSTTTLKSEDSATAVLEEKTLRSNDSTSNHFESGQNGDVGCRSSEDVLVHHVGNICSPLVCPTGRHTSSDCNQSTNILKIDVGTSTDPYDTGSKSKKRRRNKCRVDNLPIDRPEDNISSCQERKKIGLNSQNHAPVIEKRPNALATTSNTSFQQDGNVSVITKPAHHTSLLCASEIHISSGSQKKGEGPSRACKSLGGSTVLNNASNILLKNFLNFKILVVLIIVAPMMAQGLQAYWGMEYGTNANGKSLPAACGGRVKKSVLEKLAEYNETADDSRGEKLWQQFWFHMTNGSLIDQVLTIKDMKDRSSGGCSFTILRVPFFYNCSQSGFLVFVKNEMCAEILTKDLTAEDWRMEYGHNRNGDDLSAARGETLDENSVLKKITEPADGSAQGWSAEDIVKITAGVGASLILLALLLLYIVCQKFRSWVNEVVCRRGRRNTNNVPQTGANLESNTNDIPFRPNTSTKGTTNGGLQNGESKSETFQLLETDQMETDTTTQAEDSVLPCSL